MPCAIARPSTLKLSICITTLNRAALIGATLDSILAQLTNDCEVVILDSASTDDTPCVISEYARRFNRLHYVRQEVNDGIDRDYDRVVELARGEYCWLMTDDDLLKPGAVAAVLEALRRDVGLVIVNFEYRDFNMSKVLLRRRVELESDRVYRPEEMDRLFLDVGDCLKYIGAVVIKRSIWLARDRQRYCGSLFNHVGVIFQEPLAAEALVIAQPFISYRWGNAHTFSPKIFETMFVKWPSLVWSLALSDHAKSKVCSAEPWRSSSELLLERGLGTYSLAEYRRLIRPRRHSVRETLAPALIALLPGVLVNALLVFYFSVTRRLYQGVFQPAWMLYRLRESRFHRTNWRFFKRAS